MRLKISDVIVAPNRRNVDEFKVHDLADSIREVGLLNPITVTPENHLVAGTHRLEAFKLLGKTEIDATVFEGDALHLELAEIDENLIRNELDPIGIGELAVRRDEILESLGQRAKVGGNGSNQHTSNGAPGAPLLKTTESIAEEIGISKRALLENKQLAKNLVPEAKEIVRNADVTKKDALKIARMEPDRQKDVAEKIKSGKAKSVKEAELIDAKRKFKEQTKNGVTSKPPTIHLGDGIKWISEQEPCDLLLTDPPYSTDVPNIKEFAQSWLPTALRKLKMTGSAYVFVGAYPNELAAYTSVIPPAGIKLEQILVWTYKNTLGNNPKDRYKQNWQAILFYRGQDAPPLECPLTAEQWGVIEMNAPDGRLGNRFHAWQKPIELAERFIRHSTKPGDTVLDPFCCTGTFPLAAAKLGRTGLGAEINRDNAAIAIERGCVYAA